MRDGILPLNTALAALTSQPARILKLNTGHLGLNAPADVCLFDPEAEWTPGPSTWLSRGQNTPYWNQPLKGQVIHTLVAGEPVYNRER